MLSSETKRKIDNARDILVGKIPTPTGQVEHITLALMYKFMNDMDNLSKELGGRAKFFIGEYRQYTWKNIMDPATSAHERVTLYSQGLEKMSTNPSLPLLFREIFKRAFLPFRDPEVLTLFLKQIDGFTYDHSEELGNAFEYLLSIMGTQGEAGQLRTPRHIIDFIVKVVAPIKTDRILDPACGTAGFLISAFKLIMSDNIKAGSNKPGSSLTQAEKNNLPKNFVGYDISHDMVRLSLVNLYLHEFPDPKIYEYDTLTSIEKWDDDFDCILANPPFMTPKGGIRPHRRFQIQANRSEVLFVGYIMEHLTTNGKAGVIVPEGIIFQSANAYKALRKMMVEQNYLWAVVSLPAGVFQPYSGVKTSILLMDRAIAKKTENILFVKVENDGFDLGAQRNRIDKNDLPGALEVLEEYKKCVTTGKDFYVGAQFIAPFRKTTTEQPGVINAAPTGNQTTKMVHVVSKTRIAEGGDYNLTGDRYRENGVFTHKEWPMVELNKVCSFEYGKSLPERDRKDGPYPVVGSNGVVGYHNIYLIGSPAIIVGRKGSAGEVVWIDKPCFPIDTTYYVSILDNTTIDVRYLYHVLKSLNLGELRGGGAVPGLNRNDAYVKMVPLPPLEVQREIVAELDGYQKIIDGAKQVVVNYKPQIKIDPAWPLVELGKLFSTKSGTTPKRDNPTYFDTGNIPWVKTLDLTDGPIYNTDEKITELAFNETHLSLLPKGTVLVAMYGGFNQIGRTGVLEIEATHNQAMTALLPLEKVNPYFLNAILVTERNYWKSVASSTRKDPNITKSDVLNFKIPLPPLSVQKQIVAEIEEEQKLVEANRRLIEIFEKKIKNKIDEAWGRETPEETEDQLMMAAEEGAKYGDK